MKHQIPHKRHYWKSNGTFKAGKGKFPIQYAGGPSKQEPVQEFSWSNIKVTSQGGILGLTKEKKEKKEKIYKLKLTPLLDIPIDEKVNFANKLSSIYASIGIVKPFDEILHSRERYYLIQDKDKEIGVVALNIGDYKLFEIGMIEKNNEMLLSVIDNFENILKASGRKIYLDISKYGNIVGIKEMLEKKGYEVIGENYYFKRFEIRPIGDDKFTKPLREEIV